MEFASSVSWQQAEAARKELEAARETVTTASDLELFRSRAMRLTCIAGVSGLPQVSIPVGTLSGAASRAEICRVRMA
jgi:hypothetical protein